MKLASFQENLKHFSKIQLIGPLFHCEQDLITPTLPTILIDGGIQSKKKLNEIFISVGDGDSSDEPLDIKLPTKKDISDLSYALSIIPHHINEISLVGLKGGRTDHELANFGELHQFLKLRDHHEITFSRDIKCFSKGSYHLEFDGTFSVMSLEVNTITIEGDCLYEVQSKQILPFSSLGLSNQGYGKFKLLTSSPAFVIFNSDDK